MKRAASVIVAVAMLLCMLPVWGCALPTGQDTCIAFLSYIEQGNYSAAYDMLSQQVRYDEDRQQADLAENKEQSKTRISREQFVNKYTAIFDEMEIDGIEITSMTPTEGNIISVMDYTLVYKSDKTGDIEQSFRMDLLLEEGQWKVNWAPNLMFSNMQWGDTVRVGTLRARRGEILADGTAYAQTVNALTVFALPSKIEDEASFVQQVTTLLDMTSEQVYDQLKRAYNDFTILKQYYPHELDSETKEQLLNLTGVGIDEKNYGTLRYYPQGDSMAHFIGYVGSASKDDLMALTGSENGDETYNLDSIVGKTGLEQLYERELCGKEGYYIFICSEDGTNRETLYREPAQNGMDVQLTIEAELQEIAENALKYSLYGDDTAGAIVVLQPYTGEVLSIASYPSYDLNTVSRNWDEIVNDARKPLFNRVTQGQYPPGSIIKPFIAAAALEDGVLKTTSEFPGNIKDDVWRPANDGEFGPWKWGTISRIELNNRHTPMNMINSMIDSDNIYFAYAALKLGWDALSAFLAQVGFDAAIEFDLSVSAPKIVNEDTQVNPQLVADSGYGQGELLITPLQIAAMYTAFATGTGDIVTPYLVNGLYRTNEHDYAVEQAHDSSVIWREDVIQSDSIDAIEPMLEQVVKDGTAQSLKVKHVEVAAKTGTAEIGHDKSREISWIAAYRIGVSQEDARLVLVMVEIPAKKEYAPIKFNIATRLLEMEKEEPAPTPEP